MDGETRFKLSLLYGAIIICCRWIPYTISKSSHVISEIESAFQSHKREIVNWGDILPYQYCPWWKFWRIVLNKTKDPVALRELMDILFPTVMGHRSKYYSPVYSLSFNSSFYAQEKELSWPDNSFERFTGKFGRSSNINYSDFMMGTKMLLNDVWKQQHPMNCDNKKYTLIRLTGHGVGFGAQVTGLKRIKKAELPSGTLDITIHGQKENSVRTLRTLCASSSPFLTALRPSITTIQTHSLFHGL